MAAKTSGLENTLGWAFPQTQQLRAETTFKPISAF